MTAEVNLRGKDVSFELDGRTMTGVVVTHIRNGRWLIESLRLPKKYERGAWWSVRRIVLPREQFTVKP